MCEKLCACGMCIQRCIQSIRVLSEYAQLSVFNVNVRCVSLNLNLNFRVCTFLSVPLISAVCVCVYFRLHRTAGGKIRIMPFMWIGDNDLINMRQWHVLIFTLAANNNSIRRSTRRQNVFAYTKISYRSRPLHTKSEQRWNTNMAEHRECGRMEIMLQC